jgi:fructokinase
VIVLGEALVDLTRDARREAGGGLAMTARAGGSPANVAVALARLGVRARLAARISRDEFGSFLRAHLEENGVDVELCASAPEPTTMAIVGVDDSGRATYSFYVQGTADWQWQRDELPTNDPPAAIHTGSLVLALEPGAQVVAHWLAEQRVRSNTFVSLDPNVRPALLVDLPAYRQRLYSLISEAHLVKVSDEDLLALEPNSDPMTTATAWADSGPELVVVTRGSDGATAIRSGANPLQTAAIPVTVVDTVGAGDAFTAGLIAFLADHDALRPGSVRPLSPAVLKEALGFAGRVAALTCTRSGADSPWRAELESRSVSGFIRAGPPR